MKLVVGLGNPRPEYFATRHNAGFLVADQLTSGKWIKSKSNLLLYSWLNSGIELIKPLTYMNESGRAVAYAVKKHRVDLNDLFVIHDDLDIKLGDYKIQFGKGPKDHNGLKSIDDELGQNAYWHVRVGVDNRDPGDRTPGEAYVLQNFTDAERRILDQTIKEICKKLATLLKGTN
ncbi:MAG TPA: aminoacyl-tRNA hydrolase [Patescibacteria group bacterium]|nr:aminoacyl-tRNA hydrolase [Patescibacteria group bacterium]